MTGKILFKLLLLLFPAGICLPQEAVSGEYIFDRDTHAGPGRLTIIQNPGIDTLLNRHTLYNAKLKGMEGFRIQIYNSSNRNAREESGKIQADFISKFPRELVSYASFAEPGWYMIRVGDFRTKTEATKYLLMVRKVFPDAYLVPDIINFPDLNKQ
ncbi:MAG TPA: SPOR domain-containing protein [Bacteroidales bacterium]|nr:hypothetical protein [Bacteroidales bacterium]HNR42601.1 SPOR domain-containing protein [Bacteroidales bacterium]HPM19191.1 SPOR domain-containing protein [Bacteroidales bacterium]